MRISDWSSDVCSSDLDQHRGLPFRDMIDRVPFFGVGAFPPRAAMIPFVEPELLGLERHRAQVEDAVVLDEAFEAVGPLARDPVHHIAAIGGAERAGVLDSELLIILAPPGPPALHVLPRL